MCNPLNYTFSSGFMKNPTNINVFINLGPQYVDLSESVNTCKHT